MNLNDFLSDMKIELGELTATFVESMDLDMFGGEFVGQCSPIFRWVGGKTRLLSAIRFYSPSKFNTYFEPFIGGGAIFFSLMPKSAVINDVNPVIINLYKDIRDNYRELVGVLDALSKLPDTEAVYLTIRDIYNDHLRKQEYSVETSGMFLFINARCFNGLYRVNSNGEFNVGYAKDSARPAIYVPETLQYAHDYFSSSDVSILCGDFLECMKSAKEGDFVYFDPPYVPVSETKNFTSYAQDKFDEQSQLTLFNEFKRLSDIGVKCMLSNSECEFIRDLYSDYTIKELNISYCVQPNSSDIHRSELLVMNF